MSLINEEKDTSIGIYYKSKWDAKDKIRIFGEIFVKNNKDKCKIIYQNEEHELTEYFEDIDNNYNHKDEIIIELKINNDLTDISYMFSGCDTLKSFLSIPKWKGSQLSDIENEQSLIDDVSNNIENKENYFYDEFENLSLSSMEEKFSSKKSNYLDFQYLSNLFLINNPIFFSINSDITNMSNMFNGCESLIALPDISKWNTSNVNDMEFMFAGCKSLIALPDLSIWNTQNVNNSGNLFSGCSSLISLPDISKWNTEKNNNMSNMFNGCSSLISFPDLSKWNTNNVIDMSALFYGCNSIISLPDISKWNINNVNNMEFMFFGCSSLISLPDISKWDTSNVTNMSNMFNGCSSLLLIPDISKWNISKCKSMRGIFYECSSITSLPDISKWNMSNVIDISNMFKMCNLLISLPDISKWNTSNVNDISNMFEMCYSLISIPDISSWKHNNINIMINIFDICKSLKKKPDLTKWNIPIYSEIKGISYFERLCPLSDYFKKNNIVNVNYIFEFRDYQLMEFKNGGNIPNYEKEINIKFIGAKKSKNKQYISIFKKDEELCGLLKLCLLKEISRKLDNNQIKKLPELLSYILRILKNSFIEDKIEQEEIKNILNKVKGSNIINFSRFINKKFELKKIEDNTNSSLKKEDLVYIKDIKRLFLNYNEYIKSFEKDFEIRKRESIFEFSIISLVIMEREEFQIFEEEREKCPNRVDKILYHGTQIKPISLILEGEYKKSEEKSFQFGKGVYFTDSLDYCWYYGGDVNNRSNLNNIPNIGETFTFIANSIYYDKKGFKRVTDKEYSPKKNEINFAYASGDCKTIYDDPDETKFYGTEYVIWELEQICPLLGAKLKRNEYCIIWKDENFSSKPFYNNKFDDKFKQYLSKRMEYIEQYSELNIYTCETTEEALKLVERKKYNKIILISNFGQNKEGPYFIKKAREILGRKKKDVPANNNNKNNDSDTDVEEDDDKKPDKNGDGDTDVEEDDNDGVIAFFSSNNKKHLKDIIKIKNAIFSNRPEFLEEYLECFSDKIKDENRKNEIIKVKKKIEEYYKIEFDFNDNFLSFPHFKKKGKYNTLKFKVKQ